MKKLIIVLGTCLAMAGQAWAGPAGDSPAPPAPPRKTPIIEVVAVTPAPEDSLRLQPALPAKSPDLRLAPGLVQALNLDRKPAEGSSPLAVQAGPFTAQFQSYSDSPLDRRLEGLRQPGTDTNLGYQLYSRLDDSDPQGGFLSLRFKASAAGEITLGGGYVRAPANSVSSSPSGSASAVRGSGALSSSRSADSGSVLSPESNGRWGAFLAMPYQLGRNIGLQPEVSYYRGDLPDAGRDSTNEWVMGLRFTFGF